MMQTLLNIGFTYLVILLFSISIFSQTATKIDEIGLLKCGDALNRFESYYQFELQPKPQNKLYVIYYEAQYRTTSVYDFKTKKHIPKLIYPRFGDALNKAKEIPLFLKKVHKISANRIVLVDGGFRQKLELEIWSVPEGAEPPQPTPTLERKDIKFAKGKPFRTFVFSRCYENY